MAADEFTVTDEVMGLVAADGVPARITDVPPTIGAKVVVGLPPALLPQKDGSGNKVGQAQRSRPWYGNLRGDQLAEENSLAYACGLVDRQMRMAGRTPGLSQYTWLAWGVSTSGTVDTDWAADVSVVDFDERQYPGRVALIAVGVPEDPVPGECPSLVTVVTPVECDGYMLVPGTPVVRRLKDNETPHFRPSENRLAAATAVAARHIVDRHMRNQGEHRLQPIVLSCYADGGRRQEGEEVKIQMPPDVIPVKVNSSGEAEPLRIDQVDILVPNVGWDYDLAGYQHKLKNASPWAVVDGNIRDLQVHVGPVPIYVRLDG